jgi:inorganic phosphate transporter, PiT family
MVLLILAVVCFLAFNNGANDNFKGVATLFGSGTTNYKKAITWATVTTFLGSVTAIFLAETMVKNFSGKGLLPDSVIQAPAFMAAIALGAALTVFIATRIGMPVSTTHGLVGALTGSGLLAAGDQYDFTKLGKSFVLPLLLSPVVAIAGAMLLYYIFRQLKKMTGITRETCMCVGETLSPETAAGTVISATATVNVTVAEQQVCTEKYVGRFLGINAQEGLNGLHYLSSGIVSFARGLNDTPKIAGMLLVLSAFNISFGMLMIAVMMALGGIIYAKKVGLTMSTKITPMNHGQGFSANLVTGSLVTLASIYGLPVSTTHVSVGSIFGIGLLNGNANSKTILKILLSWVLTLPVAALCSGLVYSLLNGLHLH